MNPLPASGPPQATPTRSQRLMLIYNLHPEPLLCLFRLTQDGFPYSHDPHNFSFSLWAHKERVSAIDALNEYQIIPKCDIRLVVHRLRNDKMILQNDCITFRSLCPPESETRGNCVTKAPEMRCLFKSLQIKNS